MPYKAKGKCVYKKDTGAKVGCTKGDVNDYLAALHMHANESISEEFFRGGKADEMTPEDIARIHNVPVGNIESQLRLGTKIELEHVDNDAQAREIAMDHLVEMPDYYDKLIRMEKNNASRPIATYESDKHMIKALLREELNEGLGDSLRKVATGVALGGALAGSPQAQAATTRPPIEHSDLGVKREGDSIVSTVRTDGPSPELAKELAFTKAKEQLVSKGLDPERLKTAKVVDEKVSKNRKGTYDCVLKILVK